MGLNSGGFALSALGSAPEIPSNVGKIDVSSIYDRVVQGMQANEAIRTAAARQQATDAQLRAQALQAPMQTAILAQSAAQAPLHTSLLSDQANISNATTPGTILAKNSSLDADLATEQNRRDLERAKATVNAALTPAQAVSQSVNGAPTSTTQTSARNPDGTVVSTGTKTADFGGETVPVATNTSIAPPPVFTPFPGGIAAEFTDASGKRTVQRFMTPSALLRQNVGVSARYLGPEINPASGEHVGDNYISMLDTAAGGVIEGKKFMTAPGVGPGMEVYAPHLAPAAAPVTTTATPVTGAYQIRSTTPEGIRAEAIQAKNQGFTRILTPDGQEHVLAASVTPLTNAPLTQGAPTTPTPSGIKGTIQTKLEADNRMSALNDLASERQSNDAALVNVQRISDAVEELNKNKLLPNALTGNIGFLDSTKRLNGATSQFASDIIGKFKGAGRVTQREFDYANASYPQANQPESVQRDGLDYLKNYVNAVNNRINYEYQAVKSGILPSDAKIAASQKFPILPPKGFTPPNG